MIKSRKNITKKLVTHISTLTNGLFKQSVIEVMNCPHVTDEEVSDFMIKVRRAGWGYAMFEEPTEETKDTMEKKEKIDDLYLSKMMMLNTQDLSDILFLHEHSKPRRAQRTLEAIYSELTRRSIMNDSSQSDAIYLNGDVDVKRKGKLSGKTASTKKRKANKNI